MFNPALTVSLATGGMGVIASAPTLSHGPSAGTFVIDNYDSNLRYAITAGTRSGNTITLGTSGTVICQVTAFTAKGVTPSAAKTCERRTYTESYVQIGTEPGSCNYLPFCGAPNCNNCPGCANCTPSGDLCIFCSGGGPIFGWVKDPLPSGYTDSYGEWWKIT
jgi:hypothetical protein